MNNVELDLPNLMHLKQQHQQKEMFINKLTKNSKIDKFH